MCIRDRVYHALRLGAVAYCAKDVPPDGLLNTIHAVFDGNYVVNNQVLTDEEIGAWFQQRAARYNAYPTEEQPSGTYTPLSPREMEILEFVTRGASNKAVSYTHLRAHETVLDLVCRLLLEKKKKQTSTQSKGQHTHQDRSLTNIISVNNSVVK